MKESLKALYIEYKPFVETALEVLRWVVLFVVSWILTETISQLGNVPESSTVTVWVFSYVIPVRLMINGVLAVALRIVDKLRFELQKAQVTKGDPMPAYKGLTGF